VNVSVNVPLDAPLGTAKSTVTLAVSDPDVSVTDDGTTVHVEFGGPPLQVRLMVPWNPVVDDSVSIKTAMWPGGMLSVMGETAIVKSPTLRFAEAILPVPPLVEVTLPLVLVYCPAAAPVTVTLN